MLKNNLTRRKKCVIIAMRRMKKTNFIFFPENLPGCSGVDFFKGKFFSPIYDLTGYIDGIMTLELIKEQAKIKHNTLYHGIFNKEAVECGAYPEQKVI